MAKITAIRETRKVKMTQEARGERGSAIPIKARELRVRDGDPADKKQGDRGPSSSPTSTSGRECTGYQEPVYS